MRWLLGIQIRQESQLESSLAVGGCGGGGGLHVHTGEDVRELWSRHLGCCLQVLLEIHPPVTSGVGMPPWNAAEIGNCMRGGI